MRRIGLISDFLSQPGTEISVQSCFRYVPIALVLAIASPALQATDFNGADVWYDPSPDSLVVVYHEIYPELAESDSIPRLRIFGDGRVLVHYASPLRRAGDYQLRLNATELDALLSSLVDNGLVEFDQDAVAIEKEDADEEAAREARARGETPSLFYVADETISLFELNLSGYRAPGASLTVDEIHRQIRWRGLRTDSERYPQIQRIQRLRAAELTLQSLLVRGDLERIR
jgi:hypothetical protein